MIRDVHELLDKLIDVITYRIQTNSYKRDIESVTLVNTLEALKDILEEIQSGD